MNELEKLVIIFWKNLKSLIEQESIDFYCNKLLIPIISKVIEYDNKNIYEYFIKYKDNEKANIYKHIEDNVINHKEFDISLSLVNVDGNYQILLNALVQLDKKLYNINLNFRNKQKTPSNNTQSDIKKLKKHVSIVKLTHDRVMNELQVENNIYIWKNFKNSLFYRIESYGEEQKINKIKLSNYLFTVLNRNIVIYDTTEEIIVDKDDYIIITLLPIINMEIFDPFSKSEFVPYGNLLYKNTFQYTNYLLKRDTLNNYIFNRKSIICDFIKYLVQDDEKINFIILWLSNYFKSLKKSKDALVLIGDKKATEEILIDQIIKPIFAHKTEYFSTINDASLSKESNELILKDKIFYHLKEITRKRNIDKANELVRRAIFQKDYDFLESYKKEEIYTFGQLVVTASNENPYVFLKDIINRCVVFKTNNLEYILDKLNIDRITLEEEIVKDLENFSNFLLNYDLSLKIYKEDSIYFTNEKKLIIEDKIYLINEGTVPVVDINDFIKYILHHKRYISKFEVIKEDPKVYDELIHNFEENMIARQMLSTYFNMMFQTYEFKNNEKLLNILREKDKFFEQNIDTNKQYNRKKRYILPEQKDLKILKYESRKRTEICYKKDKIDYKNKIINNRRRTIKKQKKNSKTNPVKLKNILKFR